jgi:integrase
VIHAPDGLLEILSEHIRMHCAGEDSDRWLFPSTRHVGGRMRQQAQSLAVYPFYGSAVDFHWRAIQATAGISCRLHDLRHFYASGLIYAGCDVVTVQRSMGHQSATTTLETYAHLWPDASDRTRRAAAELLERSLESTANSLRTARPDLGH